MFTRSSSKQTNDLANQALKSTRRMANEALESLAGAVQDLQQVEPLLNRARDQAQHASDETVNYIKDEPIKAILIAAATGAALMALISYARGRS